jgi:hypothetical protein
MSIATFIAQNFDPKVDVSTVFWRFDYHRIGAIMMYTNTPV